jgi:hypothetical protein
MSTLNKRQKRVLAALLTCSTARATAKQADVCEKTVYRYLEDPAFKQALRARQDQVIAAAVAALSGLAGDAIDTLRGTLANKETTAGVRVRAALGILDHVQRLTTFADLEQRLAELEAKLQ